MARPADKPPQEPEKSGSEKAADKPTSETGAPTPTSAGAGSGGASRQGGATAQDRSGAADGSTLVERLKSQHAALQAILDRRSAGSADFREIARAFASSWLPHDLVEREILGSAVQNAGGEALAEVEIRKDLLNILLVNLLDGDLRDGERAALDALAEQFAAVAQAAQREEGGLFQSVESAVGSGRPPLSQIEARFERAKRRFGHFDDDTIGEAIELLAPRRLSVSEARQQRRERSMPNRYSGQTRDRDEQGRFLPEEDREYGRGGGSRHMSQRDEGGRFVSDERRSRGQYDEESGRGRRSMGRDYDEDDRRSSGPRDRDRGQGGWFGDSEGHSEASRRGWESADHGRSGWYGDREGHSEASRRGWENTDHGRSGWYGDREGHSEASRRGWENADHGRSGWYGDSEGHSEAAHRGWEDGHRSQRHDDENGGRSQHRDDDNGRYARSRHEDDDRRSSSGGYESRRGGRYEEEEDRSSNGRRGWSGDPEGHSEASRRGWERRR